MKLVVGLTGLQLHSFFKLVSVGFSICDFRFSIEELQNGKWVMKLVVGVTGLQLHSFFKLVSVVIGKTWQLRAVKRPRFFLHPTLPLKAMPLDGLTRWKEALARCPNAKSRKPSSRIFMAALMSLSCTVWHLGHCQLRIAKLRLSSWCKQLLQVFEQGKNLSISM
jgi:hypothetical protein